MMVRDGLRCLGVAVLAALIASSSALAWAQGAPDRENGRYTFSQANDGSFLRLDSRTGNVSTCKRGGGGWACYLVPDERDAFDKEIGRLQADNARLKDELAKRDLAEKDSKTSAALPKSDLLKPADSAKPPEDKPADSKSADSKSADSKSADDKARNDRSPDNRGPSITVPLPSEREIDRAMALLEHAWRRLVEAAGRMQRDVSGRI